MRSEVEKNMDHGEISVTKRVRVVIGNYLKDPFFDSYEGEALALCDILESIDRADGNYVIVRFNKAFLKKIVHSHILRIREIEQAETGKTYAH